MRTILQMRWETGSKERIPRFLIRLAGILILYLVLEKILFSLSNLPYERYHQPVLFWGFVRRLFSLRTIWILVPAVFLALYNSRRLFCSWDQFEHGQSIRFMVLFPAIVLAWTYSTYDYNLFIDYGHIIDRLLLVFLIPLIFFRPVFVMPFLFVLLPVIWQFEMLEGFSWAAPSLPIRILLAFTAFHLFFTVTKQARPADFFLFAGCIIATHYWVSGTGKLNWDWIRFDQVPYLLPATYANGWLAFLAPETISSLTNAMLPANGLFKAFTLLVECGAVLIFFNRHTLRFLLAGFILLHTGIFLTTGICFWMWAVVDAGLLIVLFRKNLISSLPLFNKTCLFSSILLIATGAYWCRPIKLAWLDVPFTYTYRFEGQVRSGKTIHLPPSFFAPFDYQFTLGKFGYLADRPVLGITWGATYDTNTFRWFLEPHSSVQLLAYEAEYGLEHFDEEKARMFDAFVLQFVQNWNSRLSNRTAFSVLKAPRLLWTFPNSNVFDRPEPLETIRVILVTSCFLNGKYEEISLQHLREIRIPEQ